MESNNFISYIECYHLVLENKHSVVLVEAFVVKEADEILPKRLKIDPTSQDSNLPTLTGSEGTGDIIKHFNFALKCWNMLNSTDVYQKGKYSNKFSPYLFNGSFLNGKNVFFNRIFEIETAYKIRFLDFGFYYRCSFVSWKI